MKIKSICGWAALAALGFVIRAEAQTAPEILAKMIEAQGGRTTLASVKDTTTSGTMELVQMGMSGNLTMYQKEPNKFRMDLDLTTVGVLVTTAFDGEKGWSINPQTGASEEMTEKQAQAARVQALGNEAMLNPEKFGITFQLKGKEKVGDKECFVIEQTFKDGLQVTVFVDRTSYLTLKTRSKTDLMGTEVEQETLLEDYKKVNGMMIPHKMVIFQGGAEFGRLVFTKVAFNSGLEDSFFKMK
jgi:outer membrane lipoprotein-sorting protein